MRKTTTRKTFSYFAVVFIFSLVSNVCLGQRKEFTPSWEIGVSTGQSFIGYFDGFGESGGYSTGLTIAPEVSYSYSRFFTASFSMLFTTAHEHDRNASYDRVSSVPSSKGAVSFTHHQTTFAPVIHFTPVNSERHNAYVGFGPALTFGQALKSESVSEVSTTIANDFSQIGLYGTLGYKFRIFTSWNIGGRYVYNKNEETSEHIMFTLGYTL
ncbi:hypothetical protein EYV94_02495 [Puteibacter caeruleilacunae]|nr:hypothetical protein EYV94_02495 [Puteibacter caeruleilacunae]